MDYRKDVPEYTEVVMNGNSGASNGGGLFIENIICKIRFESATSASCALFYSACSVLLVVMLVVKAGAKTATCSLNLYLKELRTI